MFYDYLYMYSSYSRYTQREQLARIHAYPSVYKHSDIPTGQGVEILGDHSTYTRLSPNLVTETRLSLSSDTS